MRLLDWRLRRTLRKYGLPDLPEVRRMMRLDWWNGVTLGCFERRVNKARIDAMRAARSQQARGA